MTSRWVRLSHLGCPRDVRTRRTALTAWCTFFARGPSSATVFYWAAVSRLPDERKVATVRQSHERRSRFSSDLQFNSITWYALILQKRPEEQPSLILDNHTRATVGMRVFEEHCHGRVENR